MGKLQKQGNTGKKVMKKLRNGMWVAVAVMGMVAIPAGNGTVSAQETEGTKVTGEMTIQSGVELAWVANTVDQVQSEMELQSVDKDQAPLEQYDIIWGDTLSVIAQATDSTVDELVALNNIENPDLIYAGDVLLLADGTLATVVEQPKSDATNEQETVAKEEVQGNVEQDEKAETPKQEVEQGSDKVAVETSKAEDTVNPTPVTNEDAGKEEEPAGNENKPKEDVEKPTTKPEAPKEEVKNPDGVVEQPSNGGGEVNDPDEEEPTEPETPEDEETPVEPTEPPVEEETPQEPTEPETPNVPGEEVTPVDPVEDPTEVITPQEPTEPETPTPAPVPDDEVTPVDPEEEPIEVITPPVVETPSEPGEGEATPEITTSERTVTEQIGYNVIRRANPDLAVGEERVVQEGSFGSKEAVFKMTYSDGHLILEELVKETVTVEKVDRIVEYGTKAEPQPEITTSTKTVTEQVGYKEIRRANPDLAVGEERVVQEGSFGSKETVYKLTYEDGVLVNEVLVSEGVTVQPVNTITEYGTKVEPEITTSTKTETEQVGYKEIRRNNPELPLGEERVVQEGSYGEKVFEYLLTYEDGELISEELVSETVSTEPVDRIIEVGTYVAPELNRVDKVLNASDAEAYNLANNMSWEATEEYENMTQDEMTQLANAIDYGKLNAEFEALINQHRESLGLGQLEQFGDFANGTNQIAKELADYGYIAPNGSKGHELPNGQSTETVFSEDLLLRGRGENIAFRYNQNNPYQIVSEKYLAETFFQQWLDSPPHKQNMEFDVYTGFSFAVQPVVNGNTKTGTRDAEGNHVITGNADVYSGVGIVAVLSLVMEK